MPTLLDGLSRIELILLRQNHSYRLSIAQSRLLHWKALTHAASSLSGDYATEDKALFKFMLDLCVRAAAQQKACVVEIDSLTNQMRSINFSLRPVDRSMSIKELFDEQAEVEGKSNAT
jgi:Zn-dependent oligopeptidase